MTQISGKKALVTGGASGIGRLMAFELAAEGATVAIWDINEDALDEAVMELRARTGREHFGWRCDVSDREAIYARAKELEEALGPLDILINNAGVVSGESFLDLPDEKVEATFKVNALALFWTTKAFLPGMIERNSGHVVTIASAAGLIGVAKLADYSASKFAAFGLDESLRMELGQRAKGVKTTVVCPFFIDTGMFEGVRSRFSFLLPVLKETEVAKAVIKAIRSNRRRLLMPPIVYTVPILRGLLPPRLFDIVANVLGIDVSMKDFIGRAK